MSIIKYAAPASLLIQLIFNCAEIDLNNKTMYINGENIDTVFQKDSLWIKTSSLIWIYDTSTNFSCLKVFIKGSTNSKKVGIVTFGDGIVCIPDFVLNNDNFEDTVTIEFRYGIEIFLTANTTLILHYLFGIDSVNILLKNPLYIPEDTVDVSS